jgi:ribosomal protein S18 acetylase RimI-like enzyme
MAEIEELDADGAQAALDGLVELIRACVLDGASIGFVLPFPPAEARAFWAEKVIPAVRRRERRLLAARDAGRLVGTVQLDLAAMPNQRHRADVSKLMVHPEARRRGVARRLMQALEPVAAEEGRWLLTLDTRSGDSAEPLYRSLGFEVAGSIAHYARAPDEARYDATIYMFKVLAQRPAG